MFKSSNIFVLYSTAIFTFSDSLNHKTGATAVELRWHKNCLSGLKTPQRTFDFGIESFDKHFAMIFLLQKFFPVPFHPNCKEKPVGLRHASYSKSTYFHWSMYDDHMRLESTWCWHIKCTHLFKPVVILISPFPEVFCTFLCVGASQYL